MSLVFRLCLILYEERGGVIENFNVIGSKGLSKKENFGEAERYSNLILEIERGVWRYRSLIRY